MKIRIGNFQLTSDPHQFIIAEIKVAKEGKNAGKEYEDRHTYHPTIESALNHVLRRGLLDSNATTLVGLLADLKRGREELHELLREGL